MRKNIIKTNTNNKRKKIVCESKKTPKIQKWKRVYKRGDDDDIKKIEK